MPEYVDEALNRSIEWAKAHPYTRGGPLTANLSTYVNHALHVFGLNSDEAQEHVQAIPVIMAWWHHYHGGNLDQPIVPLGRLVERWTSLPYSVLRWDGPLGRAIQRVEQQVGAGFIERAVKDMAKAEELMKEAGHRFDGSAGSSDLRASAMQAAIRAMAAMERDNETGRTRRGHELWDRAIDIIWQYDKMPVEQAGALLRAHGENYPSSHLTSIWAPDISGTYSEALNAMRWGDTTRSALQLMADSRGVPLPPYRVEAWSGPGSTSARSCVPVFDVERDFFGKSKDALRISFCPLVTFGGTRIGNLGVRLALRRDAYGRPAPGDVDAWVRGSTPRVIDVTDNSTIKGGVYVDGPLQRVYLPITEAVHIVNPAVYPGVIAALERGGYKQAAKPFLGPYGARGFYVDSMGGHGVTSIRVPDPTPKAKGAR